MKIKLYISANKGLPNLERSLRFLFDKIHSSKIPYNSMEIISEEAANFEYPALQKAWLWLSLDGVYAECSFRQL